ncbi:MAG: short-chain dehydrogenase [Acidimicrobiales bacterium mtb01]|nr:SDR family oxidoreductase [Actinomycetota bacterium]TEX44933.1 MAG: short-chain dehydrogenase [Acidimicrobiales bacterium mtb01]
MDLGISGRRALVTGASSGLGLSTACALAADGVQVVIAARSREKLDRALTTFPAGSVVHAVVADVSDLAQVDAVVAKANELVGGIDILVANAGGPPPGNFASTPVESYDAALRLNLVSTVAMCKAVVPAMQKQKWGRVLAITSSSVREPIDRLILSNTARAGLTGFLKTLAREVAGDGITVNSLQPGLHATDRLSSIYGDLDAVAKTVPAGRLGDPDDFGHVAAFVCSEHAKFVTGVAIPLDGGALHGLQ